jgi:hypothetical protein
VAAVIAAEFSAGERIRGADSKRAANDEMVRRASIIMRLEQMEILVRVAGENWGSLLRFRLKTVNTDEIKAMIYENSSGAHEDFYFDDRFAEGKLPRIFDPYHHCMLHDLPRSPLKEESQCTTS